MIALVVSCPERTAVRKLTLADLNGTDWNYPVCVVNDSNPMKSGPCLQRIETNWLVALKVAAATQSSVLFLEDDVHFNIHIKHNLMKWIGDKTTFYGRLYRTRFLGKDVIWGSQAIVMTADVIRYVVEHWRESCDLPDNRMPLLASQITTVQWHAPSIVDHRQVPSTWSSLAIKHKAVDFDRTWRAP